MHSRISLNQVAFLGEPTAAMAAHCRAAGIANLTLVMPMLMAEGGLEEAQAALAETGLRTSALNHVFGGDLDREGDDAIDAMLDAVDAAASLGADTIYLLSGGRGALDWNGAAARFAELVAPARARAAAEGVRLIVENANGFNADIHIAHTFDDAVRLAETAGIGLCVDLHGCWYESDLKRRFARAMPLIGLVQVSDYVLGDRTTPCRAVPGDGAIPLERLVGDLLDMGYAGLFDLELIGPRISAEGPRPATLRAAEHLSGMLARWGV